MKCSIDSYNKQGAERLIVRRKFVPIQFKITGENQFVNAGTKLPFTANKVIGMLTTSIVRKQCSDDPVPPRLYWGISTSKIKDTRFLKTNPGEVYTGIYPPSVRIREAVATNVWWYYAHPVTDTFPLIYRDDIVNRLDNPMIIDVIQPGQCHSEKYYLWSEPYSGYVIITYKNFDQQKPK